MIWRLLFYIVPGWFIRSDNRILNNIYLGLGTRSYREENKHIGNI